jgi:hypothetical protein
MTGYDIGPLDALRISRLTEAAFELGYVLQRPFSPTADSVKQARITQRIAYPFFGTAKETFNEGPNVCTESDIQRMCRRCEHAP